MIAEDARFVPLLKEAESTLEYFETKNKQGLLTNEEDVVELENLRALVASLCKQKDATLKKYEAITNNPDVYEKVWEEAHEEKISRELKEKLEGATKKIQDGVNKIADAIEQLLSQTEFAYRDLEVKNGALNSAETALRKIIDEACENLSSDEYRTTKFLKDFKTPPTYGGYITGVEQYRKSLGFFKRKEKAAVDRVLREKDRFDEAGKKSEECHEARKHLETLNAQVDELAEQYKTLLLEAWDEENEIKKEFPAEDHIFGDLPRRVHSGLENSLKGKAYPSPNSFGKERGGHKPEEEKLKKLNELFCRIEKKAGPYLWINNPEKYK